MVSTCIVAAVYPETRARFHLLPPPVITWQIPLGLPLPHTPPLPPTTPPAHPPSPALHNTAAAVCGSWVCASVHPTIVRRVPTAAVACTGDSGVLGGGWVGKEGGGGRGEETGPTHPFLLAHPPPSRWFWFTTCVEWTCVRRVRVCSRTVDSFLQPKNQDLRSKKLEKRTQYTCASDSLSSLPSVQQCSSRRTNTD